MKGLIIVASGIQLGSNLLLIWIISLVILSQTTKDIHFTKEFLTVRIMDQFCGSGGFLVGFDLT